MRTPGKLVVHAVDTDRDWVVDGDEIYQPKVRDIRISDFVTGGNRRLADQFGRMQAVGCVGPPLCTFAVIRTRRVHLFHGKRFCVRETGLRSAQRSYITATLKKKFEPIPEHCRPTHETVNITEIFLDHLPSVDAL